ncbi:hypothetical protein O6P43_032111 [Quillaja saponaria]|uniref:Uncharacterized protein n=1 Tax=Quillaja saponaria TaxID=32244 RepID=A0AAD7KWV6_QUISA|nr:hypothetical protein O6P43_032111 [Quillaja saponaria]
MAASAIGAATRTPALSNGAGGIALTSVSALVTDPEEVAKARRYITKMVKAMAILKLSRFLSSQMVKNKLRYEK